ncbi:MAG: hypothetical protein PVI21_06415 [Candidatus Woesebacteria bacterium]|jgi:hypothetical protein
MSDFDFDELDKAVNSLVAKKRAANKSVPHEPAAVVKDISLKLEPPKPQPELPAVPEVKEIAAKASQAKVVEDKSSNQVGSVAARQVPSAAVLPRRGGRLGVKPPIKPSIAGGFIDNVVSKPKPAVKVSRVAADIKPDKVDIKPDGKKEEAFATPKPEVASLKRSIEHKDIKAESWPDPLDFRDEQKSKADEEVVVKSTTQSKESSNLLLSQDVKGPEHESEPEPASPFITNAKVEKRPLGAYAEKVAQELARPAKAEQEEMVKEQHATEAQNEPKVESSKNTPESHEKEVERQVVETTMMSIPQQYKSTQEQSSQVERNIFDTKEYHPPLLAQTAHAAKNKGFWGTVLIVLLVTILLAVGLYFGFLYFIQSS